MSGANPQDVPAMPPPPGQVSDFVNPPSLHGATVGVGIAAMVIMTVAVGIRTWTTGVILKKMKHEDYIALLALIGFNAWIVIYIYVSHLGITRDLWNIRAVDLPYMLYVCNIFQLVYPPAMLFAKYFVLVQLERIFCPAGYRNSVWWAIKALLAATVIYYIACFFLFLFQCTPREKIWNAAVEGTCVDNQGAVLSAGLINLLLDLGILVTPIWAIWHLQMSMKRKLGVMSIFAVGIATCAIAAAGVAYRVPLLHAANVTMAIARVGLWTMAELVGTIVVGCMPTFPRFFDSVLNKPGGPLSLFSRMRSTIKSPFSSSSRSRGTQRTEEESKITMNHTGLHDHTSSEAVQQDYIELQDGDHAKSRFRAHEVV
ncbi:hypothetical protein V8F20_005317 [Naviculisporaceae sp. PSN 640]